MTPDLFSGPVGLTLSPPTVAANRANPQRHVLPNNLPAAIKHLSDGELDQLLSAILAEQEQRGTKRPSARQSERKPRSQVVAAPLSVGRSNAIRAAFKAGVKPSRIAREFGLSQSDVRKALAGDKTPR